MSSSQTYLASFGSFLSSSIDLKTLGELAVEIICRMASWYHFCNIQIKQYQLMVITLFHKHKDQKSLYTFWETKASGLLYIYSLSISFTFYVKYHPLLLLIDLKLSLMKKKLNLKEKIPINLKKNQNAKIND